MRLWLPGETIEHAGYDHHGEGGADKIGEHIQAARIPARYEALVVFIQNTVGRGDADGVPGALAVEQTVVHSQRPPYAQCQQSEHAHVADVTPGHLAQAWE